MGDKQYLHIMIAFYYKFKIIISIIYTHNFFTLVETEMLGLSVTPTVSVWNMWI